MSDFNVESITLHYSPLRKRVVAHIRQTREAAQRVAPPLPSASPSDQMAGQSLQHQCSSTSRHAEHPYTTHPKTPTVARSCSPYGIRSLAKASPLRGTVGGRPTRGPITPLL